MKYKSTVSERIVVGALINNINFILEMKELKSKYFVEDVNKMLYVSIKRLFKAGSTSIDVADVYAVVETNKSDLKLLEKEGGVDYLNVLQMMGSDKAFEDIQPHVDNIIKASFKNELEETLNALSHNISLSGDKTINEIYSGTESRLLELKGKYTSRDQLKLIGDTLDIHLKSLKNKRQNGNSGFPTFSPTLNKFVTYEKTECVIISGKKKTGKSQYVINEIYRLCIIGKLPCAVLDTELSTEFFIERLIARITGFNIKYIKKGKYEENEEDFQKYLEATKMIEEAPLVHQYVFGMSQGELTDELKRLKIQMNLQMVFYDYIKANVENSNDLQERLQMAQTTNWLKNTIAGDLRLAVVALCQTSPTSDNLSIFGSNQVAMYASTVIFLVKKSREQIGRDYGNLGGNYYLTIPDNRNGAAIEYTDMGINIDFNTRNCTMKEASYQCQEVLDCLDEDDE